jgi:hypothetical protein
MIKRLALISALALASCSSPPPPESFAPLNYSYLTPITFKVATLNVVNAYVPGADEATLNADNPAPPGATLMTMLNQRMQPSGQPGTGTITVQVASITEAGGTLSGQMTVDINLASADGRSTGFAEASVSASAAAPSDDDPSSNDMRTALYQLTKQLMDAINVQLPYSIAHNIPTWVDWTTQPAGAGALAPGAGLTPGAIEATPLTGPPGSTAAPSASGAAPIPAPVAPVNTNQAVPSYLPGAGPTSLTPPP